MRHRNGLTVHRPETAGDIKTWTKREESMQAKPLLMKRQKKCNVGSLTPAESQNKLTSTNAAIPHLWGLLGGKGEQYKLWGGMVKMGAKNKKKKKARKIP